MKSGKSFFFFLKIAFLLILLASAVSVVALTSCSVSEAQDVTSSDIVSESQPVIIPVDVSLSDAQLEMGVSTIHAVKAEGGEAITWQSSDDKIATVDKDGNITGIGLGECDLTAENEFGRTAQCHVTVKKTVFLTIDDGPLSQCEGILNTLKEYDVKATFFVIDTYNLAITKRMRKEGHLVGLHTFSHSYGKCYRDDYSYYAGLEKLNDNIEQFTGERSNIIRFPGGSGNSVMYQLGMRRLVSGIDDLGYRAFDWTASAGDSTSNPISSDTVAKNVKRNCYHDVEIVLMHERLTTIDALKKIIPSLLHRGYVFDTLDHFSEHSHLTPTSYERNVSEKTIPCKAVSFTVSVEKVSINQSSTVQAKMDPDTTTDYLRFTSDDPSIAKVTLDGIVTGLQPGTTSIRAIASSGAEAVCNVTVEEAENKG